MTREIKEIVKLTISAIIAAFAIAGIILAFTYESRMNEAFENGYEQAILDAELTGVSENEYTISFQGNEHIYTK